MYWYGIHIVNVNSSSWRLCRLCRRPGRRRRHGHRDHGRRHDRRHGHHDPGRRRHGHRDFAVCPPLRPSA